ncbi:MAG: glycosyltransferase family 1 protein, partial [Candidatus Delongbacteria bacterium]|nr:glycosyltransferase family 1 protein [Candidatus Delongbacteria bacterium]
FLRWPISLLTRLKLSILYAYLNHGLKKVCSQLGILYKGHSFNEMYKRADRLLGLWSKEFRSRSEGDPDNLRICGFPFSPKENDSQLSPSMKEFLSTHSSPVVVALGTSARNMALEVYEKVAQACENLGKPCVLIGCDEKSIETRFKNVITTPFEPYDKLFSKASLIMHHGGIGTCAEAFYSGHPNIIIPFMADQFDNAFLAEKLGVAAKALNRSKLSVQKLENVISESLGNKERQEKAVRLSEALKKSGNGAVVAAEEIKKITE